MTDLPLLSDEELSYLTEQELLDYFTSLEYLDEEWVLSPKQLEAEALSAQVDELMYGGAAGGGKSEWLLWHARDLSLKHKNHRTLALRRTLPQLKDSLIRRSLERFRDQTECHYVVSEKEWRWRETGSTIRFGFCDTDDDVRHYLSTEYDLIIFEELTEFTERQYTLVRSRNRTTAKKRAAGVRPHTISATNPGQVGHGWVKARFVDATNYGEHIAHQTIQAFGKSKEMTVAFVPAKVADNPHIDPDYVFNLASLPEIEQQQYLYGNWDIFAGQFFTEFSRERHVMPAFPIPPEWPKVRAIDYGYAKPYCCLWIAFDWDGNAYVYRETYATLRTGTMQAKEILAASVRADDQGRVVPEKHGPAVADPSIWNKMGTGLSIAQMYRDAGLVCTKAKNARVDGWSRLRDYLAGTDESAGPKLVIFDCCVNLIRTLPLMIYDEKKAEDLNTTLEDHAPDALRYGLATRGKRARRPGQANTEADIDHDFEAAVKRVEDRSHPVMGAMNV